MNRDHLDYIMDKIERELGLSTKGTRRRLVKKTTDFANENINHWETNFNTDSFRLNSKTVGVRKNQRKFSKRSKFSYSDFID